MKKLVASLAAAVLTVGVAATSVSAEEYEVEKGDSLWNIANDNNTTVDELVKINDLSNTMIQPKQTLIVSEEDEEDSLYVVKEGDTLTSISDEFDVSVKNIKKWNELSSDLILVGQELQMNGVRAEAPAEVEQVEEAETEEVPEEEEVPEKEEEQEQVEQPKEQAETEENTEKKEEKTAVKAEETKSESPEEETEDKADKEAAEKQPEANDNEDKDNNNDQSESPEGKTVSVEATAYTAHCEGCSGVTATGVDLNADPDAKVIAVDPSVIPLGSKVYVEGYGYATADDTGGDIKGDRIDLHVPSTDEALDYGRQSLNVTIVE